MAASAKRAKSKRRAPTFGGKRIPQGTPGLWIDRELLRRHMNPLPKVVLPLQPSDQGGIDRYLELADTLLQTDRQENTG